MCRYRAATVRERFWEQLVFCRQPLSIGAIGSVPAHLPANQNGEFSQHDASLGQASRERGNCKRRQNGPIHVRDGINQSPGGEQPMIF
jgi:hypothetical protein